MKTTSSPNLSLPYRKTSQKNLWQQSYTQHICLLLPLLFPPMVPSSLSPSGLGLSNPCPSFSTLASSLGCWASHHFNISCFQLFFSFLWGVLLEVWVLSAPFSLKLISPIFFEEFISIVAYLFLRWTFPYCSIPYFPPPLPFLPLLLDFNVISFAPPLVVFFLHYP